MNPVFGTPQGTGVRPNRRDRHANANREHILEGGVLLVLVDQNEAARIDEAFHAAHRRDATEARDQHREAEGQFVGLRNGAVLGYFLGYQFARFDFLHARIADPFDVLIAHCALKNAFGIAHAVEADMTDIRLCGDEGHRHLVAKSSAPQLGVEDEGIFVGGAEAGRTLNRTGNDRAGLLAKFLEGQASLFRVVDVTNRLCVAVSWS